MDGVEWSGYPLDCYDYWSICGAYNNNNYIDNNNKKLKESSGCVTFNPISTFLGPPGPHGILSIGSPFVRDASKYPSCSFLTLFKRGGGVKPMLKKSRFCKGIKLT